jgi:hypothetical protein
MVVFFVADAACDEGAGGRQSDSRVVTVDLVPQQRARREAPNSDAVSAKEQFGAVDRDRQRTDGTVLRDEVDFLPV